MIKGIKHRWITGCVAIVASLTLVSAAVPVEDDIIMAISSPQSPNYYPNLMMRFGMGDPTLTESNYHHLYYGYAYQDNYRPLEVNPYMDKFLLLASGLDIESPNHDMLRELIAAGEQTLTRDPFNLKVWNMLTYAYGELGDEERQRAAAQRVDMIMLTIKSSGSALKQNSPQHILMFDHALDLLAAEGLQHRDAMVVSRTVEYIPLIAPRKAEDGGKVKGFYFDFGRIYWNKPDSVTYQRDRTWQFNNLPPKVYK